MINKIVISGNAGNEAHETAVYNAFVAGYNLSDLTWNGSVIYDTDTFNQALIDKYPDVKIFIRSYTGFVSYLALATANPDKLIFIPCGDGDTDAEQLYSGSIPASLVLTGCGTTQNTLDYKVEFFDQYPQDHAVSFSNGYIAGKIAAIADYHSLSVVNARHIAHYASSLYPSPTSRDGYGLIDMTKAFSKYFFDYMYFY